MANEILGLVDATTGIEIPDADARYAKLPIDITSAPTIILGNADNGDTLGNCHYLHDNGLGANPYNDGIAEAIANLPARGGIIYVRPGLYNVKPASAYVVPNNCRIVGEGVGSVVIDLTTKPSDGLFDISSVDNCSIEGMTINVPTSWTTDYCIRLSTSENSLVKDVRIESNTNLVYNFGAITIIGTSTNIRLKNVVHNKSEDLYNGRSVYAVGTSEVDHISAITIDGCEMYGYEGWPGYKEIIHFSNARDVIIKNNRLYSDKTLGGFPETALTNAIRVWENCYNVEIRSNKLEGAGDLIGVGPYPYDLGTDGNNYQIKIINNLFLIYGNAVHVTGHSSLTPVSQEFNVNIIGNIIVCAPDAEIPDKAAARNIIDTSTPHGVIIADNNINLGDREGADASNHIYAIRAYTLYGSAKVTNNYIESASGSYVIGIYADVANECTISNNTVRFETGTGISLTGVEAGGFQKSLSITGNSVFIEASDVSGTSNSMCYRLGQAATPLEPIQVFTGNSAKMISNSTAAMFGIYFYVGSPQNPTSWNIVGNSIFVGGTGTLYGIEASAIGTPNQLGQAVANVIQTTGTHIGPLATPQLVLANNLAL